MNIAGLELACADRGFFVRFGRTGTHKEERGKYFCSIQALMGSRSLGTSYSDDLQIAKRTAMMNALKGS